MKKESETKSSEAELEKNESVLNEQSQDKDDNLNVTTEFLEDYTLGKDLEDFSLFPGDEEPSESVKANCEKLFSPVDYHSEIILEKKVPDARKYRLLKDFLLSKGFKIWGDIDFWYDCFEFFIETDNDKFMSTLHTKEYFEAYGFIVETVSFRDWTVKGGVSPSLRWEKFYRDGKKGYIIRISVCSSYFEDVTSDEDELLDEPPTPDEEPLPDSEKKLPQLKTKTFFSFCVALIALMALIVFLTEYNGSGTTGNSYKYSRMKNNGSTYREKTLDLEEAEGADVNSVRIPPLYFDLVFETSEGTKQFSNAEYDTVYNTDDEFNKNDRYLYRITCYDEIGKSFRWEYFPTSIVKSISKENHHIDDGEKESL